MASNLLNFRNEDIRPHYIGRASQNSANLGAPKRSPSMQLGSSSLSTISRLTSSLSFDSIKSRTAHVSSGVMSTIRDGSQRVTQMIKNSQSPDNEKAQEMYFPSIFEQLKWPNLSLDNRLSKKSASVDDDDEESIVDRFVRVIQSEDGEDNAQSTFFNHPSRRHNDREEIRRRLAMGGEDEPPPPPDHRKLSLQTRLQTGMNLQICFMNETASDCESQCSDTESTQDHRIDNPKGHKSSSSKSSVCLDFASRQTQLQAEARQALGQAKDMARMQMEVERQQKRCSPVTEIIRQSFSKIGLTLPDNKRRLSRQLLTDMNVAQLQVIVNHLHTQIEGLNEELVRHLLNRDDLHMEQDSRLVDIEDLTNHLAAKERSNSSSSVGGAHSKSSPSTSSSSMSTPSTSSRTPPSTTSSTTPRTPVSTPPPPMSAPLPNDALRMKGFPVDGK